MPLLSTLAALARALDDDDAPAAARLADQLTALIGPEATLTLAAQLIVERTGRRHADAARAAGAEPARAFVA
jgi:hypothetical protein